MLRWQSGLHTFGLLYDLGYGSVICSVIFSARIGGFVSVPTCEDLAPSSSSDPCRVGLRGWWHTVLRGVAPRQQLQAINERWGCDGRAACTRSAYSATSATARSSSRRTSAGSFHRDIPRVLLANLFLCLHIRPPIFKSQLGVVQSSHTGTQ